MLCIVERGSFVLKIILENEISIIANTSIVECSDVAVLVINRVKDYDIRVATTMMTVIGEDVVVNFNVSADQYTCTPLIKLVSGRRLYFPSFKCSTGKVGISISIF